MLRRWPLRLLLLATPAFPATCPPATPRSLRSTTRQVVARQYKRRLDNDFVLYYDLVDYDETFFYEEELVSGKPAKIEVERQFDANVVCGAKARNRRAGRATRPERMSICTKWPAGWSGSTSST